MQTIDTSAVIKSASVISSVGGVALQPRIETPTTPKPAYGIEQAVELLESLPQGGRNRDLVYQVVKTTLQSLEVEVEQIVADAQRKERELEGQLETLETRIAEFEAQIKATRREAQGLRQRHQRIRRVREQLEQADQRSGRLPQAKPANPPRSQPANSGALHVLGLLFASLRAGLTKLGRPSPDTSQPQQLQGAAAQAVALASTPEQPDAPAAPAH